MIRVDPCPGDPMGSECTPPDLREEVRTGVLGGLKRDFELRGARSHAAGVGPSLWPPPALASRRVQRRVGRPARGEPVDRAPGAAHALPTVGPGRTGGDLRPLPRGPLWSRVS